MPVQYPPKWPPNDHMGRENPTSWMYRQRIRCTAHSKNTGRQCEQMALTGFTKCRAHGGARKKLGGKSLVNGRYTQALLRYPELRAAFERMHDDTKMEELGEEAMLLRGVLSSYLEINGGQVDDKLCDRIQSLTDSISKVVERRHRIKNGITVSVRDFESLVVAVVSIAGDVFGKTSEQWDSFCERLSQLSPSGVSLGSMIVREGLVGVSPEDDD